MNRRKAWKILIVATWTLFTVSLATWWLIFALSLIEKVAKLSNSEHLARQQQMLYWEGGVLVVLLFLGGGGLAYLTVKEMQTNQKLKEFFATFSHDLKTSLTSLRLQAQSLQEDLAEKDSPHLGRLVKDTVRLQVQLENALHLGRLESVKFFPQKIEFAKILESLQYHWPNLKIYYKGSHYLEVDRGAIESILMNLIQNAVHHGGATQVNFEINPKKKGRLQIHISDNGKGFKGNEKKIGKLFYRHNKTSGSGVGLHMTQALVKKMNGKISFDIKGPGFSVCVELPGVFQ